MNINQDLSLFGFWSYVQRYKDKFTWYFHAHQTSDYIRDGHSQNIARTICTIFIRCFSLGLATFSRSPFMRAEATIFILCLTLASCRHIALLANQIPMSDSDETLSIVHLFSDLYVYSLSLSQFMYLTIPHSPLSVIFSLFFSRFLKSMACHGKRCTECMTLYYCCHGECFMNVHILEQIACSELYLYLSVFFSPVPCACSRAAHNGMNFCVRALFNRC